MPYGHLPPTTAGDGAELDPGPIVVYTEDSRDDYENAAYFASNDDSGELEVFADDLTVLGRYKDGEWIGAGYRDTLPDPRIYRPVLHPDGTVTYDVIAEGSS